jgi:ABC-type uncharacterized transport system permease subunit
MSGRLFSVGAGVYATGAFLQFIAATGFSLENMYRTNVPNFYEFPAAIICGAAAAATWPISVPYVIHLENKWKQEKNKKN